MTEIRIYVEGGGEGKDGKAAIQRGFGRFLDPLRQLARERRIHWQVVACGPRTVAFKNFKLAIETHPGAFNVLLVDAEEPVVGGPWEHLKSCDGWQVPPGVAERHCHLMAQTVEAWIIADADALMRFYGREFLVSALPAGRDVEAIPKQDLMAGLDRATKPTSKGRYHKIYHCSDLLGRLDPQRVRARARHCDRLFSVLTEQISSRA